MNSPVFLLLLLPALAALPLARRGGRVRAALAGAALLALVLALARPVIKIPRRAGTVVVVADRSASLPPAERDAQKALLAAVEARRAEGEKLGVVVFGETAAVEQVPQPAPFAGFRASPGAEGSELFDGFELLDREQALEIFRTGRDKHGNFFSLAAWMVLGIFLSRF